MCKIFGLTSTTKLTLPALAALITRSHKALTATQKDGYGFAIGSPTGEHYVEKWDEPSAFPGPGQWPAIRDNLAGVPVVADCVTHGTYPAAPGGALIAHARTSTCDRGAINAHPHISDGYALVHNGVVQPLRGKTKSCDSMHILDSIAANAGPAKLAADVAGYLAVLVLDSKGRLSALRDDRAPLVVAWVPSLSAWAFASTGAILAEIVAVPHDKPFSLQPYRWVTNTSKGWQLQEVKPWAAAKTNGSSNGSTAAKAAKAFGDPLPEWSGSKWGKYSTRF